MHWSEKKRQAEILHAEATALTAAMTTNEDSERVGKLLARARTLTEEALREKSAEVNQRHAILANAARGGSPGGYLHVATGGGLASGGVTELINREPEQWVNQATGERVNVYQAGQKLSDAYPSQGGPLSAGKYIRGLVTGDWRGAERERAAMGEGTPSAGGYLVPSPLAASIIDKARNQSVAFQAGAQLVEMNAQTLAIARVTTDPTVAWKTENSAATASDLVFDRVTFTARTLVGLCKLSVEVVEDSAPNIDTVITDALGKVLALELDRACLRGSGTPPEPQGIRFQTGVGVDTTTFGANGSAISGTTPTGAVAWDWLSKTIYTVRGLNEYPNAAIYSERTGGELDLLRASTGVFLTPPPSVDNVKRLSTNAISNLITQGTSTDCSSCYVGDFSKLMVGMRTNVVVEVSREAGDSTGGAFASLQTWIRAYLRADVQLARPAAFRVVEGIR